MLGKSLRRAAASVVAAIVAATITVSGAQAASAAPAFPARMAALGDSISQATTTCSAVMLCPENSWSTGTSPAVASHASRLRAAGDTALVAYNDAYPGTTSADLAGQAQAAVAQGAGYVTIEMGGNDACRNDIADMTSTATYAANVRAALAVLAASPAKPRILVASVPNLLHMYEVNAVNPVAQYVWATYAICPSMLASPASTAPADVARRAAVQAQVDAYNRVLEAACGDTAKCSYDRGAVADMAFSASDVSTIDYFHPSVAGQAKLAAVTWAVSPWR